MKYKKIRDWKRIQAQCALGLVITLAGVCSGCAHTPDSDNYKEETQESSEANTDSFLDKETETGTENEAGINAGINTEVPENPDTDRPDADSGTSQVETGENPEGNGTINWEEKEYPELKYDGAGWGLVYGENGAQPRGNEKPEVLKEYNAYYIGNAEDKVIYLTFDCGYENGNTDAILKALKAHNAKGTFFVTGHFLETEAELVNRMVDEGHAVGSHSYNHPDITKLPDRESFAKELDQVKDKFHEVTGKELDMYFRPPEGKCYSQTLKWSQEMGYATIFWSVAHIDWNTSNQPEREKAIETLTGRIHPGAVVLLHNTSATNGEILDDLMTKWEEMGYTFAPLSDLVGEG